MNKVYLITLPLLILVSSSLILPSGEVEKSHLYLIPKESTYVGSIIFSNDEAHLVGGEREEGEYVKRVSGSYIIRMREDSVIIEIYSWGSRTLLKKEEYSISELRTRYPQGVSIWVEQDARSAQVVLFPWQ